MRTRSSARCSAACECECCEKLALDFENAMECVQLERARGDKWFSAWLKERQARNFAFERPLGDALRLVATVEERNSRTAQRLERLQTLRYGAPVKRGRAVRIRLMSTEYAIHFIRAGQRFTLKSGQDASCVLKAVYTQLSVVVFDSARRKLPTGASCAHSGRGRSCPSRKEKRVEEPQRQIKLRRDNESLRVRGESLLKKWREATVTINWNINDDMANAIIGLGIAFAAMTVLGTIVFYHINNSNKFTAGNYCEYGSGKQWVKCDILKVGPSTPYPEVQLAK